MLMQLIKIPRVSVGNEDFKSGNEILQELKKKLPKFTSLNLEEIHVDNTKEKEADKLIFENSKEEFEKQDRVIFVGGDGTASKEIKRAYKEVFGSLDGFSSLDFSDSQKLPLKIDKKIKGIEIFNINKEEKEKIKKAVEIIKNIL